MTWIEEVTGSKLGDIKDQIDFAEHLKDGSVLCSLINCLQPGSVKKINTLKAPFKQRENIEMYLKACATYGLKEQDLFQVNDLYENKNLYMVVDNLFSLGGMAQKKSWEGPALGVKVASENKRNFDEDTLKAGQSMIGLQYGTNKGASQAGMTPYGASRQIRLEDWKKESNGDEGSGQELDSWQFFHVSSKIITHFSFNANFLPEHLKTGEVEPDRT